MSFKNFFTGIRLVGETSDPANTFPGSLWYNSTTNELKVNLNGTPATIPTGSTGTPITAQDEGSTLTANMNLVNFVGSGVTATNVGQAVTVTIPGGGTSITAQDEGSTLTTTMNLINFVGSGVTATNVGNAVTVTIPAGGTPTGNTNTLAFFDGVGNLSSNTDLVINQTTGSSALVYNDGTGTVSLTGNGSSIFGAVTNSGTLTANSGIVFGAADGALSEIEGSSGGSAFGITTSGGKIIGSNTGAQASGLAFSSGTIEANASGARALGVANAGTITASQAAAEARGLALTTSSITASGTGSTAVGTAANGNVISVTGEGSIGHGRADGSTGDLIVSGLAAAGLGARLDISADHGQALGIGHDNSSYGALYCGTHSEIVTGTPINTSDPNDPIFVVGNGTAVGFKNSALVVTRGGHLRSNQLSPPTAVANTNSGATSTCVSPIAGGTDTRGEVVLNTSGGGQATGIQLTVTYSTPYITAPIVGVTASNDAASQFGYYVTSTTNDFSISIATPTTLSDGTEYRWTYFVIE